MGCNVARARMETIAVSEKAGFWLAPNIKSLLLMFDKILIPQGKKKGDRKTLEMDLHNTGVSLGDVEYLESKGVVCENPVEGKLLVEKSINEITKYNSENGGINKDTKHIFRNILERHVVNELSEKSKDIFVPSSSILTLPSLGCNNSLSSVYSLVLENIPIVSEEVPFDEVISFKKECSLDYRRLIQWVGKASEDEASGIFLDEISDMVERFRVHQKIGDLKFRPGKVELVFQAAGVVVDAFTLRFGSVSKTIASLRKDRADLMAHELENPGRPLSYVVRVQDTF